MRSKPKLVFFVIIFLIMDLHQASSLQVPSFLTITPAGHFAGVSAPCPNLSEARKSAVLDVVRQVLGSIGSSYGVKSKHFLEGNIRGAGPRRTIDESISGTARGIVLDIEPNIVNSTWSKDGSGNFVYFVLVRYTEEKILEMRRLSKGARLIAISVPDPHNDQINLRVSEVNGVSVTLTSADIIICQHNRYAMPISLFLWKMPAIAEHKSSITLDPVRLCGNSEKIRIPMSALEKSLIDHLLGAKFETIVTINGYDEIGRAVSVKIEN